MKGTIRKRGNTWSYIVDLPPVNGKRKQKQKGSFRTKKECETALQTIIYQITNGLIDIDGNIFANNSTSNNINATQQVYKTDKPLKMLSDVIDEFIEYNKTRIKYTTFSNITNTITKMNNIKVDKEKTIYQKVNVNVIVAIIVIIASIALISIMCILSIRLLKKRTSEYNPL